MCRYPYNNALHHHVERIIYSCLESKNDAVVNHLLLDCNLVGRILQADKSPMLASVPNEVNACHVIVIILGVFFGYLP